MIGELLADREAAGGTLERGIELTHEIAVDALPAQRLTEPPTLAGGLQVHHGALPVLQPFGEPRDPHRLLAQHVVGLALRRRVSGSLRAGDRELTARNRLPVVAQMTVGMGQLEAEAGGQRVVVEPLHPPAVALEQRHGVPEPAEEVVGARQAYRQLDQPAIEAAPGSRTTCSSAASIALAASLWACIAAARAAKHARYSTALGASSVRE